MNIYKDQIIKGIEDNINTLPEFKTLNEKFDEIVNKFKKIDVGWLYVPQPFCLFYYLRDNDWLDYLLDHYTKDTIDEAIADTTNVILQIGYVLMLLHMAEYKLLSNHPELVASYKKYNDVSFYGDSFEGAKNIEVKTINKSGQQTSFTIDFTDASGRFFKCLSSDTPTLQITADSISGVYTENNADEFILKIVFGV